MLFSIITVALIVLDQISKYLTIHYLKPIETYTIIENVFSLTYVENRGAAFGMLANSRWIFLVVSTFAIIVMAFYKIKHKPKGKMINISLCLLLSGAVGNMIDRIFLGYVVDMLEITFINYPVFNIADCFVVIGAILFSIYILFLYDDPKKKTQKIKIMKKS